MVACRSADYAPEERNSFFEEERRTYYVAMTRARKTLTLLDRRDASLPYARELEGDGACADEISVSPTAIQSSTPIPIQLHGTWDEGSVH